MSEEEETKGVVTRSQRKRYRKVTIKGSSKKSKKSKKIHRISSALAELKLDASSSSFSPCHAKNIGARDEMEDHVLIRADDQGRSVLAVFDGHAGDDVANWLEAHFAPGLFEYLNEHKANLREVKRTKSFLEDFVLDLDRKILTDSNMKDTDAGSTIIACLANQQHFYMINCGDSRGIVFLMDQLLFATTDHKPEIKEERHRIESLGFKITKDGPIWRTAGNLAMSRAIGDFFLKPGMSAKTTNDEARDQFPVIALPNVTSFSIAQVLKKSKSKGPLYVLLASDGLWDVMTNEEAWMLAVTYLKDRKEADVKQLCDYMIQEALKRNTFDNISIVCTQLA